MPFCVWKSRGRNISFWVAFFVNGEVYPKNEPLKRNLKPFVQRKDDLQYKHKECKGFQNDRINLEVITMQNQLHADVSETGVGPSMEPSVQKKLDRKRWLRKLYGQRHLQIMGARRCVDDHL